MKVCIFGAGAIGGYLAARLLKASEHEVSVLARGTHLQAIRHQGLHLITPTEDFVVYPHTATDQPSDLPPQDVVLVTLKAHTLPAIADQLAQLLRPEGQAVFINNGIPWWWSFGLTGEAPHSMPLLDPEGTLWRVVQPQRVIGCVAFSANAVTEPGVVRHTANNRWVLGEPNGEGSERLAQASALLRTRVDIATETQNQQLLEKLTRGQALQLRLQSTVEGLSIAAISYYVVSLVLYGAKALVHLGLPLHPETAAGLSIPLVLWGVWKITRRIHARIHDRPLA